MTDKDIKETIEGEELSEEERNHLKKLSEKAEDVLRVIEEKTKYTSLLELFNIAKLDIITELDKAKVDTITKFETLMSSQIALYGIPETSEAIVVVQDMIDSYRTNMISYKRKSRKEIENILKEHQAEAMRNLSRLR